MAGGTGAIGGTPVVAHHPQHVAAGARLLDGVGVSVLAPEFEDGLAQASANTMMQDRRGFLWISTQGGLHRYDGYVFTVYKYVPGDTTTLNHSIVWTLLVDRDDRLWVGTADGMLSIDARRDVFVEGLNRLGWDFPKNEATFYLWVPVPGGEPSEPFALRALRDQGVVVMPGAALGAGGEGFFRVALTCGEARLAEAAERLGRAL